MLFFFFFSSRRRHTRYWRDWSSDVCSSDLAAAKRGWTVDTVTSHQAALDAVAADPAAVAAVGGYESDISAQAMQTKTLRSEERRVGKEGRSRWSPYH